MPQNQGHLTLLRHGMVLLQCNYNTQLQEDFTEPQVLPQDRVAKVKPFWVTVPQEERLKLLSIPLSELKQRAAEVGAEQRKEQGGQGSFSISSPWPVGLEQWGSSLDKLKQQAAASRRQAAQRSRQVAFWTGTLCRPGASSSFPETALSAAQATSWHECPDQECFHQQIASPGLASKRLCAVLLAGLQRLGLNA